MIIVKLQGGLGNQMFQYALGKKLAILNRTILKLNLSFLLDRTPKENFVFREYDLDIFQLQPHFVESKNIEQFMVEQQGIKAKLYKYIVNPFLSNKYIREVNFNFDPHILSLRGNLYLDGYWQSPLYFKDIMLTLKEDFTYCTPTLTTEGKKLFALIQENQSVCLHVRRGDFVNNPINSKFHGSVSLEYIYSAIDKIKNLISSPNFIVFSDDINWCIENIKISLPTIFVTREYLQDKSIDDRKLKLKNEHYLIHLCKHFIISNSTFSWWGAWLSSYDKKIVIAPKKWFNDNSINSEDLIPKSWITL